MTVRRLAEKQPQAFNFTPANKSWCDEQIAKYPENRQASAVIPLLWKAQAQNDYWLPQKAIEKVADMLDMPYIRVLEIATFYSMFNLEPVGENFIQLCGTTPCMLRGAHDIKAVLEKRIGGQRNVTEDGKFSWLEVECLGACCNAPMVQINDDYYEDLTAENFEKLLDDLAAGNPVKKGSQTGKTSSEPEPGKANTLNDAGLYDGSQVGAWKQRFEEDIAAQKAKAEAEAAEKAKAEAEKAAAEKADAAAATNAAGASGSGASGAGASGAGAGSTGAQPAGIAGAGAAGGTAGVGASETNAGGGSAGSATGAGGTATSSGSAQGAAGRSAAVGAGGATTGAGASGAGAGASGSGARTAGVAGASAAGTIAGTGAAAANTSGGGSADAKSGAAGTAGTAGGPQGATGASGAIGASGAGTQSADSSGSGPTGSSSGTMGGGAITSGGSAGAGSADAASRASGTAGTAGGPQGATGGPGATGASGSGTQPIGFAGAGAAAAAGAEGAAGTSGATGSTAAVTGGGTDGGASADAQRAAAERESLAAREEAEIAALLAKVDPNAAPEVKADAVGVRPKPLDGPRGSAGDDLKRIKGIGPVNETKLNQLGVFHFDQIADWNRQEVRWTGTYLAFPGRIDREDWQGQARGLMDADAAERAASGQLSLSSSDGPAVDTEAEEAEVKAKVAALGKDATPEQKGDAVGTRPAGLAAARQGVADDLKRVKGIGKVNEGKLNSLGVFHFDQIAAWTRPEIRWAGAFLSFSGRIDREDWVGQARLLAAGQETEFSQRVDAGEVSSSAGGASRPDKTK